MKHSLRKHGAPKSTVFPATCASLIFLSFKIFLYDAAWTRSSRPDSSMRLVYGFLRSCVTSVATCPPSVSCSVTLLPAHPHDDEVPQQHRLDPLGIGRQSSPADGPSSDGYPAPNLQGMELG